MGYDEIYKLKPLYEDLNRGGDGWYRLQWKPIWFGTFFIYPDWSFGKLGKHFWHRNPSMLGIDFWTGAHAHNGWNRSYDRVDISIGIIFVTIRFWIKYNYLVHKDGPSDVSDKKPLDLSALEGG